MTAPGSGRGLSGGLIRVFYDLWENSLPGREFLLANEAAASMDRIPRLSAVEVQRALRSLNRIGHLVIEGPLESEFVTSLVGKEVIRAVDRAKGLIEETRARREEPDHWHYIDKLYELCKQAYPDYEPRYYPQERRGLGLGAQG